jgi:hypothetical protein
MRRPGPGSAKSGFERNHQHLSTTSNEAVRVRETGAFKALDNRVDYEALAEARPKSWFSYHGDLPRL